MKPSIATLLSLLMAAPAAPCWAQAPEQSRPGAQAAAPADAATRQSSSASSGFSVGAGAAVGQPSDAGVEADAASAPPIEPSDGGASAEVVDPTAEGRGCDRRAGRGIQVGALVGLGLSFDNHVGAINPLGVGLGVIGGGHMDALYLGGRAHVYLGDSSELPTGRITAGGWLLAAEAGYEIDLARVLELRPGLLAGLAFFSQDGPPRSIPSGYIAGSQDRSSTRLYVAPGATLLLPGARLSPALRFFYAGLDLRLGLFLFGAAASAGLESSLIVGVEL